MDDGGWSITNSEHLLSDIKTLMALISLWLENGRCKMEDVKWMMKDVIMDKS